MARGLNVDLVVAAAIELADEDGLGAVTMAAVAKRCGFTTMSLYRHVSGKDELMRRMLDSALGTPPPFDTSRWRAGLESWSHALLDVLLVHPWGIDVPITGVLGTRAQLAWLDRGLEALADTGLDEGEKAETVLVLNGYVFWTARLRTSLPQDPTDVIPPSFDLGEFPSLARLVQSGAFEDDSSYEEDYAFGLSLVLDGVGALIAKRRSGPAAARGGPGGSSQ
jgi:AcrR family transcriptional regulator